VYRIGVLGTISYSSQAKGVEALRAGLRARGYVEGKNIVIEYRKTLLRDARGGLLAKLETSVVLRYWNWPTRLR